MTNYDKVILAEMVATREHGDQLYGGRPYTYHLKCVFDKVCLLYGESRKLKLLQQIAWLHDVVEDTNITLQGLLNAGFSEDVVKAVDALSKQSNEELSDYYDRVAKNKLAFKVKIADTLSNLEHSLREGATKRIVKYTNQIQELYKRKEK